MNLYDEKELNKNLEEENEESLILKKAENSVKTVNKEEIARLKRELSPNAGLCAKRHVRSKSLQETFSKLDSLSNQNFALSDECWKTSVDNVLNDILSDYEYLADKGLRDAFKRSCSSTNISNAETSCSENRKPKAVNVNFQ